MLNRFFRTATLVAMIALMGADAWAAEKRDEKHTLRYKFRTGETLRWDVDQRSSVRNTMEGTTQQAQTKTTSLKVWKVIDVTPDGSIEFQNLVERVRMENKLPDRAEMVFDSTEDDAPPPGFEDAAKAVGVVLSSVTITPWGEVKSRDVKHHQPAADPNASITVLLPKEPVAVGDSWDEPQEVQVKLNGGGTKAIQCRRHFTLSSVENGVAVIKLQYQVLSSTTPEIDGQLAARQTDGQIRFDIDAGRVLSQRLDVDRRVLGYAGPSSSMHLVTRMEERLKTRAASVASKPK
ncbi:hypothetical protein Mal64_37480 [Pseudobythopirellula maris]|uniref:SLA1 homology domain-containing protein n=1 Tax=Pseudobythopirellula maris TaxID=2527991 RepID=A0A5C5ZIA3_9BACT|nr:hypothetical protein [Pseudobythopirellula maris]TWT86918.1 hypothetical protein Mal64_37480 [Pseudobythopirellula maris]